MKLTKIIFAASILFLSTNLLFAQPIQLALRAGGGSIIEDSHMGFSGAVDLSGKSFPIALSSSVNSYSGEGLSRTYLGLNLLITNSLHKGGLYAGGGIGTTKWTIAGSSRNASVINVVIGARFLFGSRLGGFVEGQFFANSKTNSDTDLFNESSSNFFRDPLPDFLFDNDLVLNAGLFIKLTKED